MPARRQGEAQASSSPGGAVRTETPLALEDARNTCSPRRLALSCGCLVALAPGNAARPAAAPCTPRRPPRGEVRRSQRDPHSPLLNTGKRDGMDVQCGILVRR